MEIVHKQFGELWIEQRKDGSIWFSGKDICEVLGYKNDRDALKKHVPPNHKGVAKRDTLGGSQEITIIDESGLYRLILRSQMPQAEPFMNWVTEEVIPSIRKTGKYESGVVCDKKTEKKEVTKMLRELRANLTVSDERIIERKLGIKSGSVYSVLNGYRQDVTILEECLVRAKRNNGLRKALYTYEGANRVIELLQSEVELKLVVK